MGPAHKWEGVGNVHLHMSPYALCQYKFKKVVGPSSTEVWRLSPRTLAGTVWSLYHRCEPWYARAACTPRPAVPAGHSDKSDRCRRCRLFMLTACVLPLLPQVLCTAGAVNDMWELTSPLCREPGVCVWTAHSTRGALDLASDTSE